MISCIRNKAAHTFLFAIAITVLAMPATNHGQLCLGADLNEPGSAAVLTSTALFAHFAIGGGFKTTFTLMNTGDTPLSGDLILTAQDGAPLNANLAESLGDPGSSNSASAVYSNSLPLSIPPGGTRFVTATTLNADDPIGAGWARVESTGGFLSAAATLEYGQGTALQAIVGILSSQATFGATIPVETDAGQGSFAAFAIANPGSDSITVKIVALNADGIIESAIIIPDLTLEPGEQIAHYLDEYSPALSKFKGSVVLTSQSNAPFAVIALTQEQGFLDTVSFAEIPVILSGSPDIN
jgi:hypothetical protein